MYMCIVFDSVHNVSKQQLWRWCMGLGSRVPGQISLLLLSSLFLYQIYSIGNGYQATWSLCILYRSCFVQWRARVWATCMINIPGTNMAHDHAGPFVGIVALPRMTSRGRVEWHPVTAYCWQDVHEYVTGLFLQLFRCAFQGFPTH